MKENFTAVFKRRETECELKFKGYFEFRPLETSIFALNWDHYYTLFLDAMEKDGQEFLHFEKLTTSHDELGT